MPFLRNVWVATLTSNTEDAGTDSETVFIMNKLDLDVIHRDLTLEREVARGGGSISWFDVSESQIVPEDYYLRVGIRGDDAWAPEVILASFHGVPLKYLEAGDPYHCFAVKTGRLLREALGLDEAGLRITFQSRFGKDEWLKPYTDETVAALAKDGVKRLAIVAPGFVADCLETLEELDGENREVFLHSGGEKFAYLPCLNDSEEGMAVLRHVVDRELQGWI